MRSWFPVAAMLLFTSACSRDEPQPPAASDSLAGRPDSQPAPALVLVDSTIPPAVAGEAGWNYQQSTEADLDGDGQPERIVLTAQVEMYRGRPAWDDGQPWQVYIESRDTTRTYLFAQRLQLGTLTMRLGRNGNGTPASVVLLLHLPDKLALYEATYHGPGKVVVMERYQRDLDPTGELAGPALP